MISYSNYKKIFIVIITGLILFSNMSLVQAQSVGTPSLSDNLQQAGQAAQYDTNKNDINALAEVIGTIIFYFFSLLAVIFLGLLIYAGFLWMTAHGNEDNVTKAKHIIRNALIGLIIVIGSYAIVYFVMAALGNSNINNSLQGF